MECVRWVWVWVGLKVDGYLVVGGGCSCRWRTSGTDPRHQSKDWQREEYLSGTFHVYHRSGPFRICDAKLDDVRLPRTLLSWRSLQSVTTGRHLRACSTKRTGRLAGRLDGSDELNPHLRSPDREPHLPML